MERREPCGWGEEHSQQRELGPRSWRGNVLGVCEEREEATVVPKEESYRR